MPVDAQEQLFASARRGMEAKAALEVVLPMLLQRRTDIVRDAILAYRDHSLDGIKAMLYVAALAENAKLEDDLRHDARMGDKAIQKARA